MNIGMVCVNYLPSISTVLSHVCVYLSNEQKKPIDLFISGISSDLIDSNDDRHIISLIPPSIIKFQSYQIQIRWSWKVNQWINKKLTSIKQYILDLALLINLKRKINRYNFIICVEFYSLYWLEKIGFNMQKVCFFSLESTDALKIVGKTQRILNALANCAFTVTQSKERGDDFNKELDLNLDMEYLPVSISPKSLILDKNKNKNENCKLVYSGYIDEWACLKEFILSFKSTINEDQCNLLIHSYNSDRSNYFDVLKNTAKDRSNIMFDVKYYDEKKHFAMLSSMDIGIALYSNVNNSINWQNLIFSSGKIANYLWAGLAVITNIESELTSKPPFLKITNLKPSEISIVINQFNSSRDLYRTKAIEVADKYYNLDVYMGNIIDKVYEFID